MKIMATEISIIVTIIMMERFQEISKKIHNETQQQNNAHPKTIL